MKNYDAYLFDWDGTLSNSLDIWLNALQQTLAKHGVHIGRQETATRLGVWELMLEGVPEAEFEAAKEEVTAIAHPQMITVPLYPDVALMLQTLKGRNKKIALITASGREVIDLVLAHHELVNYFDIIITGSDVQQHKPDPEGIKVVLEHFGIDKSKAVMLGDSDKDLGAAQNAGIDSILFTQRITRFCTIKRILKLLNQSTLLRHGVSCCNAERD